MAQNTTLTVPANTWTQITNSDITSLTFHNQSFYPLQVKGTLGAIAPSDFLASIEYAPGEGERNVALEELWPGTVTDRVYVFCTNICKVMVSHA